MGWSVSGSGPASKGDLVKKELVKFLPNTDNQLKTVTVTGATGFVGRNVIKHLQKFNSFRVIATGRDEKRLREFGTEYVVYDLNQACDNCYERLGRPDLLIHLAWEGLPNYKELFHVERNLPASYRFLKCMIQQGLPCLTVTGTCYEYGLQNGCLTEDVTANPVTNYGIAKDSLRRFLEALQLHHAFRLHWARLFYMYGEGQNPKALIPLLDRAIDSGAKTFNMSGGEQLRDYLSVEEAAEMLVKVSIQKQIDGIINICSGMPVSIRHIVEQRITQQGGQVKLNLGVLPYPEHEPMAYWGDSTKLAQAVKAFKEAY